MDMRRTASVFMIWNAICVYVGKVLSVVTILFFVGGGGGWGGVVLFFGRISLIRESFKEKQTYNLLIF